jgi:hypothetical protein
MGGRAGILNIEKYGNSARKGQKFGRAIFIAHSLLSETIFKNLYFKFLKTTIIIDQLNIYRKKRKTCLLIY